jgi:hypothetical protein
VKLTWDDNTTAGNVGNNLGPGSTTVTIVDKCLGHQKNFYHIGTSIISSSANTNALIVIMPIVVR